MRRRAGTAVGMYGEVGRRNPETPVHQAGRFASGTLYPTGDGENYHHRNFERARHLSPAPRARP